MNPGVPDLLSRVLAEAGSTLDRPSGDLRRLDRLERLFDEVAAGTHWATDDRRGRLINDWTVMLVKMLRMIERLGPLGDAGELARAMTVGLALLPYVQADARAALDARAAALSARDGGDVHAAREGGR